MNKFTLYDLLGLLLPGFILTWLFNAFSVLYQLSPYSIIGNKFDSSLGIVFCLSMILGAILYVQFCDGEMEMVYNAYRYL